MEERLELFLYDILKKLSEVKRLLGSDLRASRLRLALALTEYMTPFDKKESGQFPDLEAALAEAQRIVEEEG